MSARQGQHRRTVRHGGRLHGAQTDAARTQPAQARRQEHVEHGGRRRPGEILAAAVRHLHTERQV